MTERTAIMNDPKRLTRSELIAAIDSFATVFSAGDLDATMAHFTPDAVYGMYDGKEYQGIDQIRTAFAPQFQNAFGRVTFDLEEMIVDEENQSAVVRWACQHDLHRLFHYCKHPAPAALFARSVYGTTFKWHGLDVLHFEGPLLKAKLTYSKSHMPLGTGEDAHEPDAERGVTLGEILSVASG